MKRGPEATPNTFEGPQALRRLLELAERSDTGQARTCARFVASAYNGEAFPFDPYLLRTVDQAIGDDMLSVLAFIREGTRDPHTMIENSDHRIEKMIDDWGMKWPK
jgi:hypothetical protein